jgi:alpha 1,6-mannosyltransferase
VPILLALATLHYMYIDRLPELGTIINIHPKISTPAAVSDLPDATASPSNTASVRPVQTSWAINPIPEKHWQTWKVNAFNFSDPMRELAWTWRDINPNHRYELLSDGVSESFVASSFGHDSAVTQTFLAMKDNITRADLIRYLILSAKGGVYSDVDTKALKPIKTWIPKHHEGKVNVVIGLEIDEPNAMWGDWADNFCFCQSTMMAAPNHRIFEVVIDNIVHVFKVTAQEQKTTLSKVVLTFQDVLRITGPVAFTSAVFQYLSETTGTNVTRANFTGINVPKRMADVLVLPAVAFVPGQPHSQSGSVTDKSALVQHMGMGSWRETHVFDKNRGKTVEEVKAEEAKEALEEEARKKEEEIKKAQEEEEKKNNG